MLERHWRSSSLEYWDDLLSTKITASILLAEIWSSIQLRITSRSLSRLNVTNTFLPSNTSEWEEPTEHVKSKWGDRIVRRSGTIGVGNFVRSISNLLQRFSSWNSTVSLIAFAELMKKEAFSNAGSKFKNGGRLQSVWNRSWIRLRRQCWSRICCSNRFVDPPAFSVDDGGYQNCAEVWSDSS